MLSWIPIDFSLFKPSVCFSLKWCSASDRLLNAKGQIKQTTFPSSSSESETKAKSMIYVLGSGCSTRINKSEKMNVKDMKDIVSKAKI